MNYQAGSNVMPPIDDLGLAAQCFTGRRAGGVIWTFAGDSSGGEVIGACCGRLVRVVRLGEPARGEYHAKRGGSSECDERGVDLDWHDPSIWAGHSLRHVDIRSWQFRAFFDITRPESSQSS